MAAHACPGTFTQVARARAPHPLTPSPTLQHAQHSTPPVVPVPSPKRGLGAQLPHLPHHNHTIHSPNTRTRVTWAGARPLQWLQQGLAALAVIAHGDSQVGDAAEQVVKRQAVGLAADLH